MTGLVSLLKDPSQIYGSTFVALSAADVEMEIPGLVRTLKSSILSKTNFQLDNNTFSGVVNSSSSSSSSST